MHFQTRRALSCGISAAALFALSAPLHAQGDPAVIERIIREGKNNSKVWTYLDFISQEIGPRLTGSPNIREAADWTEKTMKDWGLSNVHLETWPFGRGWQNQKMVAMAVTPRAFPLIAYPKAWTPGTNGPVTGEAVIAVIDNDRDFDTFKGSIRGKPDAFHSWKKRYAASCASRTRWCR